MAGILKLFQPSFDKYCQFSLPCFLLVLSFFLGSCDKNSNTPSNKSKAAEGIVASGNAEGADKVDSSSEKPSGPPDIGTSAQDAALPAKDSTLKTLDFIPNQAVAGERGVKLSYQLKLVNNLAALFSCLVPCPAGLSVDEKTGQIAWTPLATQEGALTANFQAKINEVLAKTEVKFTISKGLSGLFLSNLAANTVRSFAVDSLGNTYLAGFTQAKPFEAIAYQSSSAIFLTKLGKNGQKLWTRVMSGPTANNSVGMTAGNEFVILDQKEQPLVFGHTLAGLDALTTVGGFLARFDGSGTRIQTQFIPGLTTQPSLVSTHADGSFQIITQPASPGASPAFLKLTQAGATLLNVMLPGFNFARVIIGPKRENFILTHNDSALNDLRLLKVKDDGTVLWLQDISEPSVQYSNTFNYFAPGRLVVSHVSFTDASPTGQFITGSDKQNASDIDGKVTALLASDLIINTPLVTDSLGRSIYCTYQVNQVSIILRSAEATILATHKIPVTNGATCKMISIGAGGVITVAGIASGTIAGKTAAVPNDSWVIHLDSNLIAY